MEWAFAISLVINLWFGYTIGDIKSERDQLAAIAKNCKIEEQDERKREFESATERELVRQDIKRVIAGSEQHIRVADQSGRGTCGAELDRRSLSILEEAGRRAGQINKLRLRGARALND